MAQNVAIRLLRWVIVAVLWVLVLPALLANATVALAMGNIVHDAEAWSPEEPLATGTYVIVWIISACVIVLFAAMAYSRAQPWSEWTHTATVRVSVAIWALGLGCLATAITAGIETVANPLRTVAFYAGIVAWALLGGMAVTQGLLGNRGRAALANAALAGWGALAFVINDTALALVQVVAILLGVAAIAEYVWRLSRRFGFSPRAAIDYQIRRRTWTGRPPGKPPPVHPEIDKIDEGLRRITGED